MKYDKQTERNRFAQGEWQNRAEEDPMVQLPAFFLQNLTPEQYRAHQQTYEIAYQRAVQQTQKNFYTDEYLSSGEGI